MSAKETPAVGGSAGVNKVLEDLTANSDTGDVPAVQQHATNPSDITLAILRQTAAAFGLQLSARCTRCGAVLGNSRSVAAKLGPVCRKRVPS